MPDRTKDEHGRGLPKGYLRCTTHSCGPVHDTFPGGAERKSCSPTGGSCKQGGCKCYLFRHEKDTPGKPTKPWEVFAEPGKERTSPTGDYDYACICVEVTKEAKPPDNEGRLLGKLADHLGKLVGGEVIPESTCDGGTVVTITSSTECVNHKVVNVDTVVWLCPDGTFRTTTTRTPTDSPC
jgi:hypothetical protein